MANASSRNAKYREAVVGYIIKIILRMREVNAQTKNQNEKHKDGCGEWYRAAVEGNIKILTTYADDDHPLSCLVTRVGKNTVLHLYVSSQTPRTEDPVVVREMASTCPDLLRKSNAVGDTPLHLAARYGLRRIARALIESAGDNKRQLLEAANDKVDTPLHEAIRHGHISLAKLLIEADPELSYSANGAGNTPIYLAAKRKGSKYITCITANVNIPTTPWRPRGQNPPACCC